MKWKPSKKLKLNTEINRKGGLEVKLKIQEKKSHFNPIWSKILVAMLLNVLLCTGIVCAATVNLAETINGVTIKSFDDLQSTEIAAINPESSPYEIRNLSTAGISIGVGKDNKATLTEVKNGVTTTTIYKDLQSALDAASDMSTLDEGTQSVVTLLEDEKPTKYAEDGIGESSNCFYSYKVNENQNIKIDLNGKKIENTLLSSENIDGAVWNLFYVIHNYGILEITDSIGSGEISNPIYDQIYEANSGNINHIDVYIGAIYNENLLTISGGTITSDFSINSMGSVISGGEIYFKGGTIKTSENVNENSVGVAIKSKKFTMGENDSIVKLDAPIIISKFAPICITLATEFDAFYDGNIIYSKNSNDVYSTMKDSSIKFADGYTVTDVDNGDGTYSLTLIPDNTKKDLITKWTIPSDADGVGLGTTIKLPIPTSTTNSYTVDWGDGTTNSYTAEDFPAHTYTNTEETTYEIRISGKLYKFGYNINMIPTATNTYKNYYTFTQYVTELKQWGELGAREYGFSNCTKLVGNIPVPTENSFKSVSTFEYTFYNCRGLTGSIPGELFANAPDVNSFESTFSGCGGLTGSIPGELFANTTIAMNFISTFWGCSSLTGSIPSELFANTSRVYSFATTFSGCSGLTGSIPGELFANTPDVTDFSSTFHSCWGLTGSIPGELFANTPNATNFFGTFYFCNSLTGGIPANLFANVPNAESFTYTFYGCESLTDSIPGELFANTPNVTSFDGTFEYCRGLTGSIPAELFANTPNVTSFFETFLACSGLTGSIPGELFANTPKVTEFYYTFSGCSGLTGSIPGELFANTPKVTKFNRTFYNCSGLTGSIPAELFANNTAITTIPTEFKEYNGADKFYQTFYGCSNIRSANIDILYCGYQMFYGCNNLTDITIGDNVQAIATNAFQATSPYSSTNLLKTKLTTTNNLATNYDWLSDNREIIDDLSALITEWTIPANGSGLGTTIQLPIPTATTNSYTVDWGDGTTNTYTTEDFPAHTYTNTVQTTYEIKINGKVNIFGYNEDIIPSTQNIYKDYYTFTQYLTGLKQWGELEATQYGFSYCTNLEGTIPEPTKNSFIDTIDMSHLFTYCANLTGTIPQNLFSNALNLEILAFAFEGCESLTGEIQGTWFANCYKMISFQGIFKDTRFTGNIPEDLFSNCPEAGNLSFVFFGCNGLTGNIPENLFSNNTKVQNFNNVFRNCKNLTGTIPENLFANAVEATDFTSVFNGCSGLTGSIPENLFINNEKAINFHSTFRRCTGLSGNISEKLFANCTQVTEFSSVFYECTGLTGSIPNNIFANCATLTNVDSVFYNCSGLTGSIPNDLFANCPNLTNVDYTFYNCSGLTGNIPNTLFSNNPEIQSLDHTFSYCTGLTGLIPRELFANCPNVTNIDSIFKNCENLVGGEIELDTANITNIDAAFQNASNIKSFVLAPEFKLLNGQDMFKGTNSLNSIVLLNNATTTVEATLGDLDYIGLPTQTKIYVPTKEAEAAYETAWEGIIAPERVQPILELLGEENITLEIGQTYTEDGYTVAGFNETNVTEYTQYGFATSSSDSAPIDANGSFVRTYTLTRTVDGVTETIDTQTRTITYEEAKTVSLTETKGGVTTTTYYADLQAAFDAASDMSTLGEGTQSVVTLLDNQQREIHLYEMGHEENSNSYTVNLNKNIKLNINGKNISMEYSRNNASLGEINIIGILNSGKLEIIDEIGTGCIEVNPIDETSNISGTQKVILNKNELVLNSITINSTSSIENGSLVWNYDNSVSVNLKSGIIKLDGIVYAIRNGKVIIGNDDDIIENNSPKILATKFSNSSIEFYDGSITEFIEMEFNDGKEIDKTNVKEYIIQTVSGYEILDTDNGDGTHTLTLIPENTDKYLITEWTIPANADGAGLGTTIQLPTATTNSYTVDWGDGTTDSYITKAFPTHTYTNTVETTYEIKISGKLSYFGYNVNMSPSTTNLYKDYYTFTQYLTGLKQWGELEATRYGFSCCAKLVGNIPVPTENSFKNVTSFASTFYCCIGLTGSIPAELFANTPNVTNFGYTFDGCSGLTGSIPAELFANTPNVTTFAHTFVGCYGLTGSIPGELFANTPNVTRFEYTFYNCIGLIGSIPGELFANTPNVTTFAHTFYNCRSLTGSIPAELFANTPNVTSFTGTFSNCSGLTGSIPAELFANTPNVTNFGSTFYNCAGLTDSIPAELFANTPNVTNFEYTFCRCYGLTGSIPAELFANTPKVTSFDYTFEYCRGLTGSIPVELFANTPNVTTFDSTFLGCSGLTGSIPAELFANNIAITTIPTEFKQYNSADSFYQTFYGCSNITSANINTLYCGYQMFYGCNNLTDITIGDNVQAIATDAFQATSPYDSTNLLKTKLTTTNSVATNYDWLSDNREIADDTKALITEWTIPADVDGAGLGTTIKLPIPTATTNSYTVDWGDGTTNSYTTEAFLAHTYTNTVETTYEIKVSGKVDKFGYNVNTAPSTTNSYKDYYTFTQYLTGLKQWGELEARQYGFSYCSNLAGNIPEPTGTELAQVTYISYLFNGCSNLTGSIPANLFANSSNVVNGYAIFRNCSKLTGNIPSGLFANMPKIYDMGSTFYNCNGLTGEIPSDLLANNTDVSSFNYMFFRCWNLTGSIPSDLFANNTKVTDVRGVFYDCRKLTGSIPENLFANMPEIESLFCSFSGCSGLTGSIPENLFLHNTKINSFYCVFYNCSGLTNAIPANLFDSTPSVTTFHGAFYGCSGLTGEIDTSTLFAHATDSTVFNWCFYNCTGLTKANVNIANVGEYMFSNCNNLTEISIGDNTKAIETQAFFASSPYSSTNLLNTKLTTNNSVATNYNWLSDNRAITNNIANATITLDNNTFTYDSHEKTPNVTVVLDGKTLEKDLDYTVTYENNINAGTATITITGIGDYNGTQSMEFTISKRTLVIIPNSGQSKIVGEADPELTFKYSGGVATEIPGFTGSLEREAGEEIGTYAILQGTIALVDNGTFKVSNYDLQFNSSTVLFQIMSNDEEIGSGDREVIVGAHKIEEQEINVSGTFIYNGKEQKANVLITGSVDGALYTLIEDLDYTLAYENNIHAGTATVTITGIGKYSGSVTREYSIQPRKLVIVPVSGQSKIYGASNPTYTYGYTGVVTGETPLFTGSLGRAEGENVGAYVINLGTLALSNHSAGNFLASDYELTLDDEAVEFLIHPKEIAVSWGNTALLYNGEAQSPTATVNTGVIGETIVLEIEGSGINVGSYVATAKIVSVTGGNADVNNYSLSNTSTPFTISVDADTIFEITLDENTFVYDGTHKTPIPTVKVGERVLTENIDYTVRYENNVDVGTATVIITGINNYKDVEGFKTFTITKRVITVVPQSGQMKHYGEVDPILQFTYSGNVAGETPAFTGALSRSAGENVGQYMIQQGDLALTDGEGFKKNNYTLEMSNNSVFFTILGKDISKATVSLNPTIYVYDGTAKEPRVSVSLDGVALVLGTDYTVSYRNNIEVGTATAIITGTGNYTGEVEASFMITNANLTVTSSGYAGTYDGRAHGITVNCDGAVITYGTANGVYDKNVSPAYTNAGTYTVYFKVEKANYNSYVGSETITIDKRQISTVWGSTNFTFNASLQAPTATAASGVTGETIQLKVTGAQINVGTYTATAEIESVTGGMANKENYVLNNTSVGFTIVANAGATFEVTPLQNTFVYDGKAHTPDVVVKADGVELVRGIDYTIEYSNNINVGTAMVVVRGKGNYLGSFGQTTFSITKRMLTILPDNGQSKTYGALDPVLTYTYTGNVAGEIPRFTGALTRDVGEDAGNYVIRVGTLTVMDSDTFQINNYDWKLSDVDVYFSILLTDISNGILAVNPKTYYYDGTAKTPATTLKVGDIILTRNIDYTVEYENNINVGTAVARATGIGNYKGVLEATYQILPASIADGTLTLNPITFEYDGTSKTPATTLVVGGNTLVRDKDYTVSYFNNIEVGDNTAIAVATGIGNYTGELQATFSITPRTLNGQISLSEYEYIYDKTEKCPKVTFVTTTGETLVEGIHFEVTYENNINVGTATAVITGLGNFVGEIREDFKIVKAYVDLTLKDKYAIYTGNEIAIDAVTMEGAYEDLSGLVIYHYYSDYFSETPMESLPIDRGVYYVEAELKDLENYEDSISNRAKLVIYGAPTAPKIIGKNEEEKMISSGSTTKDNVEVIIYGSRIENVENVDSISFGYRYSLDGTTWEEYTERIKFTAEGTYTVYAKAYLTDHPTIESTITTYTVIIDRTAPVIKDVITPDVTDTVVIDVEVSGDDIDEVLITEDPDVDPTDPDKSGDWVKAGEDDETPIFELTQGDEEKTIYVWAKDKAGNIAGPFEKKLILSALKVGNIEKNKTTIQFKVTDLYLHTSEIKAEDIVIYVNDTVSKGKITSLTKEAIPGGYKYTAIMEDVNGDGPISIGLNGGNVFDRAGNYLSVSVKVPTNEMTADNTLPVVNAAIYDDVLYVAASDLHMKAIIVNGKIIGRESGEYQCDVVPGTNRVMVMDEYGNEVVQEFYVEEQIAELSIPNAPVLQEGMKSISWENGVEQEKDFFFENIDYAYTKPSDASENTESRWANAKTEDGSYWVWIPRFAYQVTYYTDASKTTISETPTEYRDFDVIFLYETTNEYKNEYDEICPLPNGYEIADAFTNQTAEGGWNSQLRGFWISKYELTAEESVDNRNWTTTTNPLGGGNQMSTLAGNKDDYIRPVAKANAPAWRGISVSTAYMNAYYMQRQLGSHLVKNSEWEATFILSESEYGRNGNFIELDTNMQTGGDLNTTSTGNITGVFDLLGGVWEYTATYIPDDSLQEYGKYLINQYPGGYSSAYLAQIGASMIMQNSSVGSKEQYTQKITIADIDKIIFSDIENAVFQNTMLENAYQTSLVVYRGGDSESAALNVESVPVAGSPDSRVGYRAVMIAAE